ncbi:unnamed protein product [Amoebophrya sp. A120]|nr:unnamed protein product [Amoebophrya sp. A120]|eukprot:GSA120T00012724001.1
MSKSSSVSSHKMQGFQPNERAAASPTPRTQSNSGNDGRQLNAGDSSVADPSGCSSGSEQSGTLECPEEKQHMRSFLARALPPQTSRVDVGTLAAPSGIVASTEDIDATLAKTVKAAKSAAQTVKAFASKKVEPEKIHWDELSGEIDLSVIPSAKDGTLPVQLLKIDRATSSASSSSNSSAITRQVAAGGLSLPSVGDDLMLSERDSTRRSSAPSADAEKANTTRGSRQTSSSAARVVSSNGDAMYSVHSFASFASEQPGPTLKEQTARMRLRHATASAVRSAEEELGKIGRPSTSKTATDIPPGSSRNDEPASSSTKELSSDCFVEYGGTTRSAASPSRDALLCRTSSYDLGLNNSYENNFSTAGSLSPFRRGLLFETQTPTPDREIQDAQGRLGGVACGLRATARALSWDSMSDHTYVSSSTDVSPVLTENSPNKRSTIHTQNPLDEARPVPLNRNMRRIHAANTISGDVVAVARGKHDGRCSLPNGTAAAIPLRALLSPRHRAQFGPDDFTETTGELLGDQKSSGGRRTSATTEERPRQRHGGAVGAATCGAD